jgi:hypothetical protein
MLTESNNSLNSLLMGTAYMINEEPIGYYFPKNRLIIAFLFATEYSSRKSTVIARLQFGVNPLQLYITALKNPVKEYT